MFLNVAYKCFITDYTQNIFLMLLNMLNQEQFEEKKQQIKS